MKITVDCIDLGDGPLVDTDMIACFTVDLDDEEGHTVKDIQVQPAYSSCGYAYDLHSQDCQDDLILDQDGDGTFYSRDTSTEYGKNARYFYTYDDYYEGFVLNDDLEGLILEAINMELYKMYSDTDEVPEIPEKFHGNIKTAIEDARARAFFREYPYVVAANRYGHVASESIGWEFKTFQTEKEAQAYADEWYDNYYRGSQYIRVLSAADDDDVNELCRFLKYHSII